MKKLKIWSMMLLGMMTFYMGNATVQAGTIYTSPYVTFSPDGQAWTTDAGNQDVQWYAEGGRDDVKVKGEPTLASLGTGEHFYTIRRTGIVPVSEWQVHTSKVNCCHTDYPATGYFHGVDFTMQICLKPHFSAWRPICADCGREIVNCNFYMSKETALSLDYLELGRDVYYYYLCPFNKNLEQGSQMPYHTCNAISANRYRVVYDANGGEGLYSGYMAPSFHMYNNATAYEGREVTPQTHLNMNCYGRVGWEFMGWNTMPDGSGQFYEDGAEIRNLCEADYELDQEAGTVCLYAMWKPSESVLEIDPGGGWYQGGQEIVEIVGDYGASITISRKDITPPEGCKITYDTCGGDSLWDDWSERYFTGWKQSESFEGRMQGETYTFLGEDGSRDRITAVYGYESVILPEACRDNYSFGGWYYDDGYLKKAGDAGQEFTTTRDVTLYAQWVELRLTSEEDSSSYGGAGAVDLSWSQDDGRTKSYKIYQCAAGQEWQQIYRAEDSQDVQKIQEEFVYTRGVQFFTVPYTGFYSLEAYGAQGGDYGAFTGGLGGRVKGSFWLEQGQKLTIYVGGQENYNGGGESLGYACGGDYTSISVNSELLLVAGGGGGAGDGGDGGAGGLSTSLVEAGHDGETGGAGGGGGYLGGRAGEAEIHYHVEGVCNHVHEGSPSVNGGCYTDPVKCGENLTHTYTGTDYWYWGGSDVSYCPNCGADAGKGESCSGHSTDHYRHDCPIHGKQAANTKPGSPSTCSAVAEYALTCGRTEDYFCGYPYDGYIISAKPAYGGSSYVNVEYARSYSEFPGVREGEGIVRIVAEDIGFLTETALADVYAPDKAAPRKISLEGVQKIPVDETTLTVQWNTPQDLGTVYYHKAESYVFGEDETLSVSNITADTLVSGIWGFWTLVDCFQDTEANAAGGNFRTNPWDTGQQKVTLTMANQYLHVAAVDWAGNVGETVHIPLGSLAQGSAGVKWPVYTEPLSIVEDTAVHLGIDGRYYVRSDGKTPFSLVYAAYIRGVAGENYQPNYAIIESTEEGAVVRNTVYVPGCSVEDTTWELPAEKLQFQTDGKSLLQRGDYVLATRRERCNQLTVQQEFILHTAAHGKEIHLVPIAGVDDGGTIVYSDGKSDQSNGLWIVGDGEAPLIEGLDVLEDLSVIDRRFGTIHLQATVSDALSGVKEFYIQIENLDNGAKGTYTAGENGVISVDICADEPLFSGDFYIEAYAVDHVGNERCVSYGTTEFDLQVSIERILKPHTPTFKCGESGYLNIASWGYAERIEVEFPRELTELNPGLNHVYEYELKGAYMQEEKMIFMIPLGTSSGTDYTVTVRAYKGDKMLERHPAMAVMGVDGSILDELRTRLR